MSSQIPSLRFSRITGWMMLLAYLGSFPGLLPGIVEALASFHGEHEVHVSSSHVILGHGESGHAHQEVEQHESGVCLAPDTDQNHSSDHVLCFSAQLSHALAASALSVPKICSEALSAEKLPAPELRIYPVPVHLESVAPRPPPGKPAWLVRLRTTVLVV